MANKKGRSIYNVEGRYKTVHSTFDFSNIIMKMDWYVKESGNGVDMEKTAGVCGQ